MEACHSLIERGLKRLGITDDCGPARVHRQIRIVQDTPPGKDITPVMIGDMIRLTSLGYSQAEIARQVGCSQSAVSKNLARLGYRASEADTRRGRCKLHNQDFSHENIKIHHSAARPRGLLPVRQRRHRCTALLTDRA
jgi:hypothetical protein